MSGAAYCVVTVSPAPSLTDEPKSWKAEAVVAYHASVVSTLLCSAYASVSTVLKSAVPLAAKNGVGAACTVSAVVTVALALSGGMPDGTTDGIAVGAPVGYV